MRTFILLLLLSACASVGSSQRFVVLESPSYGCGAEEGLGCGLRLDPVLRRVAALDGVAESRVSWNGRYFRIAVLNDADVERVVASAASLLGPQTVRVDAPESGDERWFDADGTRELSRYEASVLAASFATEMATAAELDAPARGRLDAALREELELAFEAAHAAGGGVERLRTAMHERRPQFEARLPAILTPEQSARVSEYIDGLME